MHRRGFRFAVFQLLLVASITLSPVVLMSIIGIHTTQRGRIFPGIENPAVLWMVFSLSGVFFSLLIIIFIAFQTRKRILVQLRGILTETRGLAEDSRRYREPGFNIPEFDEISREIEKMLSLIHNRERELENQVRRHDAAHEKTVEQLHQTSNQLVISEKMAALGNLVSGVTHEINTPLGIGVTAASFMNERSRTIIREWDEQTLTQENLERFLKDAEETSRIIHTNLSQAARILVSLKQVATDQQLDEKREFNIGEYVQDILLSLKQPLKAGKHSARLLVDEPVFINSYPGTLTQIVNNLVLNSITHGFENTSGGEITIELTREGSEVIMRYSDNGRGLSDEEAHRVFDPFYTTRRGRGGTGLGMNIVYNLVVEKLSGTINVFSPEGGGAGFELTLPDLPEDTP